MVRAGYGETPQGRVDWSPQGRGVVEPHQILPEPYRASPSGAPLGAPGHQAQPMCESTGTKEVSLSKAHLRLQSFIVNVPDSPLGRWGQPQNRAGEDLPGLLVKAGVLLTGAGAWALGVWLVILPFSCVAAILPLPLSKPCPFQVSRGCSGPSPQPRCPPALTGLCGSEQGFGCDWCLGQVPFSTSGGI